MKNRRQQSYNLLLKKKRTPLNLRIGNGNLEKLSLAKTKKRIASKKNRTVSNSRVSNIKALQFLSFTVFCCFVVLFVPALISGESFQAIANEPKKVQLLTNYNQSTNSSKGNSVLVPVTDESSKQIASKNELENNKNSGKITHEKLSTSADEKFYVTQPGETVIDIANKFNLDPVELALLNNLKSNTVDSGLKIRIKE